MDIYNVGLDALQDWETATYHWVLLKAGDFDRTHYTVWDVISNTNEITVSGYARVEAASKIRITDNAESRITYGCDDIDFGTLGAGEVATAVLLIRTEGFDGSNIPIGWNTLTPLATEAIDPFNILITDGIVAAVRQEV